MSLSPAEYSRRYRAKPGVKEKIQAYDRRKARERKDLILEHYGIICACCGESNKEFLCLDHVNGRGEEHRREIKATGSTFNKWIIKNNFPPGFRTLCWNCNMSLGIFGYCPHGGLNVQQKTA